MAEDMRLQDRFEIEQCILQLRVDIPLRLDQTDLRDAPAGDRRLQREVRLKSIKDGPADIKPPVDGFVVAEAAELIAGKTVSH